jgi:hypothetical protein
MSEPEFSELQDAKIAAQRVFSSLIAREPAAFDDLVALLLRAGLSALPPRKVFEAFQRAADDAAGHFLQPRSISGVSK